MNTTIRHKLFRMLLLLTVVLTIIVSRQGVDAQDGKDKNKLGTNPNPPTEVNSDTPTITLGELPSPDLDAPDASLTTQSITQSTSPGIIDFDNSIACGNSQGTTTNSWWRAFNLSAHGITTQFTVTKIRFGVEYLSAPYQSTTMPITIRLYRQTSGTFPGGSRTQLGNALTVNLPNGTLYFVDVPITRTVPAGSVLVVEIFSEDVDGSFYVGTNYRGETKPTYISSPPCGINTPTTMASIGFPYSHMVLSVTGSKADNLIASASCVNGRNLRVQINDGDGPFNITGTGTGLPRNNVWVGAYTFVGPGTWTGVKVTELKGDKQTKTLGNFTCIPTATPTRTPTRTPTATSTPTPTHTFTSTFTDTPAITDTPSETLTPSDTPTGTLSDTPLPTDTDTPSDTPTDTLSPTPTNTATDTPQGCQMVASAPILISPIHRAHTSDTTPTFAWSNVAGAQSYRLMVYVEDRSFEYKKRVFTTSYTLGAGEALAPAKYLWRVRTQDLGCGSWTAWSQRNTLFVD